MVRRKIGEIIECRGYRYRVEEADERHCGGCSFFYKKESECLLSLRFAPEEDVRLFGHCSSGLRTDGKNVVFVNIGEIEE